MRKDSFVCFVLLWPETILHVGNTPEAFMEWMKEYCVKNPDISLDFIPVQLPEKFFHNSYLLIA